MALESKPQAANTVGNWADDGDNVWGDDGGYNWAFFGYIEERKPGIRVSMKESKPTMMAAQDGLYSEPGRDGFYDEYPLDGFYAPVGYLKEFKPLHRATRTQEAFSSNVGTTESKPTVEVASVGGNYLADGTYLADGSIPSFGSLTSRIKEVRPS